MKVIKKKKKDPDPPLFLSFYFSLSAVRRFDLLTGDIMETTAIFIGW